MKRFIFGIITVLLTVLFFNTGYGQEYDYSDLDNSGDDGFLPMRAVYLNAGYGASSLSLGVGGRYEFIGLQIAAAGFALHVPNYSRQRPEDANGGTEEYPTIVVSIDALYYYDLDEYYPGLSAFADIGFYSQIDTVLTIDIDNDGDKTYYYDNIKKSAGLSWGFGLQYLYEDKWILGLGYHNKNGVFAQIGISW